MLKNKRVNLFLGIVLAIACVFSATFAVYAADGKDSGRLSEEIFKEYAEAVSSSKIITGATGDPYRDLYDRYTYHGETEGEQYAVIIEEVYRLALMRLDMLEDLSTDFSGTVEKGTSLSDAKSTVESCKNGFVLTAGDLATSVFPDKSNELIRSFSDAYARVREIKDNDKNAFEKFRNEKAKEIEDEYKALTAKTNVTADPSGSKNLGAFSKDCLKSLDELLATEVKEQAGGDVVEYLPADGGGLIGVTYEAKTVSAKRAELERIKDAFIRKMRNLPKNEFDTCYGDYSDYRNCERELAELKDLRDEHKNNGEDTTADDAAIKAKEEQLNALGVKAKSSAMTALNFYKNACDDIKNEYSGKAKHLDAFVTDAPDTVVTQYVSSLSDEYRAVTVTAYFLTDAEDGTMREAKAFPSTVDGGKLTVFANANGSAKKNANDAIKAENGTLSIAYFMNITVYRGFKTYNVPASVQLTDENGVIMRNENGEPLTEEVCYKVEIDLAKYYEKYCEPRGYEKDKLTNVENAFKAVNDDGLCYSYKDGKIEKTFVSGTKTTKLDGGKLVFYTRSFDNFCITGTGLENLFTNPWTWVIIIAALILLIALSKVIAKNCKYTIKFVVNGGTPVHPIKVSKNEAIVLPESPTKTGLIFAGWYLDEDCTTRFIETKLRRRKGFKLYAKWAAPVSAEVLNSYYDGLRTLMTSYGKCSFKPTLGLVEKDLIANMFGEDNYLVLYLALKPAKAKEALGEGIVLTHKDKKFLSLPTKIVISDERSYYDAMKLTELTMVEKGLQLKDELPEKITSTEEERKAGFAYYVRNERVASSIADYFELIRIALKSYVLETDNGTFKPGDRFTFARVYYTAKEVDLYMPVVKGIKEIEKADRTPRFSDTPVHIVICDNGDMEKAFETIDKAMLAYGFTKYPENSNDLEDVVLSDTDGFAYTIRF